MIKWRLNWHDFYGPDFFDYWLVQHWLCLGVTTLNSHPETWVKVEKAHINQSYLLLQSGLAVWNASTTTKLQQNKKILDKNDQYYTPCNLKWYKQWLIIHYYVHLHHPFHSLLYRIASRVCTTVVFLQVLCTSSTKKGISSYSSSILFDTSFYHH